MIDESSVVVAADDQTSTEVDGESVILDLEDGIYYGLNPMGARIWKEIQEPTAVEEITGAITAEYDVDEGADAAPIQGICHLRKVGRHSNQWGVRRG